MQLEIFRMIKNPKIRPEEKRLVAYLCGIMSILQNKDTARVVMRFYNGNLTELCDDFISGEHYLSILLARFEDNL